MTLSTLSSPPSPFPCRSSCDDDDGGDGGDGVVGYDCCSPQHVQAQRLNNTAATCIEKKDGTRIGNGYENGVQQQQNYEEAITILGKALRISEKEQEQEHDPEHDHTYDVCSCHYCSIDGCIILSSSEEEEDDHDTDRFDSTDGTTLYQRPIYVYEGHNMGSTLIHIISFNLAVAHHLRLVLMANTNNDAIIIHNALQFYDLAYECNLSKTCSIRFDEMICNNLSHIYRYQEQQLVHMQQQQQQQQQQEKQPQEKQPPLTTGTYHDDNNSIDLHDLLQFDYYSPEEEQEEYKHNTSLISLTATISTSSSSSSATSSTNTTT